MGLLLVGDLTSGAAGGGSLLLLLAVTSVIQLSCSPPCSTTSGELRHDWKDSLPASCRGQEDTAKEPLPLPPGARAPGPASSPEDG